MFRSKFHLLHIKPVFTGALLLAVIAAGLLVSARAFAAGSTSSGGAQQAANPQTVNDPQDYYVRQEDAVLGVVTQGIWDTAQTSTLTTPVAVAAGALLPNTGLSSQQAGQIVVVPSSVNVAGLKPGVDYLRQELIVLSFVTGSNWNAAELAALTSATFISK